MRIFSYSILLLSVLTFSSCLKKKGATDSSGQAISSNVVCYELNDFESVSDGRVDSSKSSSGKVCGLVNDKIEYGYGFERLIGKIPSYKSIEEINVSFNCWMDKKTNGDVFVFSVEDTLAKKSIYWEAKGITPAKTGTWSPININYKVKKEFLDPKYVLKLYAWNKGKNVFYFDDLSFSFERAKK